MSRSRRSRLQRLRRALSPERRPALAARAGEWARSAVVLGPGRWLPLRARPARVGVVTCALNESACAAFSVGAFLGVADLCVLLDTGSDDGTGNMVRALYADEIRRALLVVEPMGPLPDHDLSLARNRGLEILRRHDIDYVLKIDADEVFYDSGARRLVQAVRGLPEDVNLLCCGTLELYQDQVEDTGAWLRAVRDARGIFWEMDLVVPVDRAYAVRGTVARGKWTDEAHGRGGEGFVLADRARRVRFPGLPGVHYSWARPLAWKRWKSELWQGADTVQDSRVNGLYPGHPTRPLKGRFADSRHPEIFARQIHRVIEWFEARERELGLSKERPTRRNCGTVGRTRC